jgi:hypothetical protein
MHGTEIFLIEKEIQKNITYPAGYEKGDKKNLYIFNLKF